MTKPQTYEKQFYDKLRSNLQDLEGKLNAEDGHLVATEKNTQLFARALHSTFSDMGDVAGMLAMGAACKYTLIS